MRGSRSVEPVTSFWPGVRAPAAIACACGVVLTVYGIGVAGVPGDAFVALLDWVATTGAFGADDSLVGATAASLAG